MHSKLDIIKMAIINKLDTAIAHHLNLREEQEKYVCIQDKNGKKLYISYVTLDVSIFVAKEEYSSTGKPTNEFFNTFPVFNVNRIYKDAIRNCIESGWININNRHRHRHRALHRELSFGRGLVLSTARSILSPKEYKLLLLQLEMQA